MPRWIGAPDDHPCDPGRDDRVGAGRRASVVIAWFERAIERRSSGTFTRVLESHDLGVGLSCAFMVPHGDDVITKRDHGAYVRIRRSAALSRRRERQVHHAFVHVALMFERARRG
jgi:hypothetical protein